MKAQESASTFKESFMVQKFTSFLTQITKDESFRKGIAAAGAGTVIAVISTLIWGGV